MKKSSRDRRYLTRKVKSAIRNIKHLNTSLQNRRKLLNVEIYIPKDAIDDMGRIIFFYFFLKKHAFIKINQLNKH